jgi:hypothetical protein
MLTFKQFLKENNVNRDKVIADLEKFLEGGLKPYAAAYVDAGIQYNIDPYLTASISMLETGRGTASVLTKYKNVGGVWDSKAKTHRRYSDVRDSIFDQARILKKGYVDQGLNTIAEIGRKYAPPGASNDPNGTNAQWPKNVSSFYNQATGSRELLAGGNFNSTGVPTEKGQQQLVAKNNTGSGQQQKPLDDVTQREEEPGSEEESGVASALKQVFGGIDDITKALS